jgi:hypothetical protein
MTAAVKTNAVSTFSTSIAFPCVPKRRAGQFEVMVTCTVRFGG